MLVCKFMYAFYYTVPCFGMHSHHKYYCTYNPVNYVAIKTGCALSSTELRVHFVRIHGPLAQQDHSTTANKPK